MASSPDDKIESAPPKRKRRWWRWPLRIILVAFAVFLCWLGSWVYWAYTVEPNPTVNYAAKLEQLARDAQPTGDDAWPLIEEATAIYDEMEEAFPREDRPRYHESWIDISVLYRPPSLDDIRFMDPDATSTEETIAFAREAIQWLRDQRVFERVASTARQPVIVPVDDMNGNFVQREMRYLGRSRGLAKAAMASMHVAAAAGDWEHVDQCITATLGLAQICTRQGTLIEHLVGYAILALVRGQVIDLVLTSDLDSDELRMIQSTVDDLSDLGEIAIALNGDRFMILDFVQHTFSDDGKGNGYLIPSAWAEMNGEQMSRFGNLQAALRPRRSEVENLFNSAYDELIEASRMPAHERVDKVLRIENNMASLDPRLHLFSRLISATGNTVSQNDTTLLQAESLRLLLAIESYRADEGAPPESIQVLVPKYIDDVPLDPLNGMEFGYHTGDHEVAQHGYVLYSYGRDSADDRGYFDPDDPGLGYRFGEGEGTDILINAVSTDLLRNFQN